MTPRTSGMKRTRDAPFILATRKKRKTKPSALSARLTQGGAGGAKSYLPRSTRPYAPELKYADIQITASASTQWQTLSSLSLPSIIQGTGPSQRIGRKIRMKGIVFRGSSLLGTNDQPPPYTLDFVMDKQPNGTVPVIAVIYKAGNAISLPNPDNDERFKWLKRFSKDDPNSGYNLINVAIKCNELITFDGTTGTAVDMATNNLLVNYCCPFDPTPTMIGTLRILYIDE